MLYKKWYGEYDIYICIVLTQQQLQQPKQACAGVVVKWDPAKRDFL